jgi:hypothetical protein
MKRNLSILAAIACLTFLGATPVRAQGSADPHRTEDRSKHEKIAAAQEAAARCLQAPNADREACHRQLQTDCKGIAVGTHCGLRSKAEEHKDMAKHVAEHQRMASIHKAAAQCLASDKPYKDCQAELSKACGGIGVGKYCGMRHAH